MISPGSLAPVGDPDGRSPLRGRRILVTGGAGFLGSHVVDRLREDGALVTVPRSREADLRRLADCRRVMEEVAPEVVIHCAVDGGGIGYMRRHPASVGLNNTDLNLHVLQASCEAGVETFVGVSSVCAYPRDAPVPMREEDLWSGFPEPTNATYGLSKRIMMAVGSACREQYGVKTIFPMPVNLYGPRDCFDPARSHVVPALIRRFLEAREAGRQEEVVWGTGQATRELLYVEDCAEAVVRCAETDVGSEPFNLGTGVETRVADLVGMVADLVGFRGRIHWDRSQPDGQPRKCVDVARARRLLGWEARVSLQEGLERTVDWFRRHGGEAPGAP